MSKIRLFITSELREKNIIDLPKDQAHYLANVMRRKTGDEIIVFNGKDGSWIAKINDISKRNCTIEIKSQNKLQHNEPDIWLCFAPVKNAPLANLVQKATELGVSKLQPVITQHTITSKVNIERMRANAIEASEQSERLTVPQISETVKLNALLDNWPDDRGLILCDESGNGTAFIKAFDKPKYQKYAILIGPEGGFSKTEFEIMANRPYITPVGMGPRILRADTAAIAALTCYMSILGDWDEQPRFKQKDT